MNLKRLINQFNSKKTKLVISGWPSSYCDSQHSGVSIFTKAIVMAEAIQNNQKIVVFAEKNGNNKPLVLAGGKVLVLRIFDHKHPSLYPAILRFLNLFSNISQVTVHSEFSANGSKKHFLLNLPFLLLIRFTGRRIRFFAHNIVTDMSEVGPHFGIKPGSILARFMSIGMKLYYMLLSLTVSEVVVMSDILYERAVRIMGKGKLNLRQIPVWQQSKPTVGRDALRQELGISKHETLILYFGFLTWYKGVDWLVKSFKRLCSDNPHGKYRLVLAGGPSFTFNSKPYYRKFYQAILEEAAKNPHITLTGFIKDTQVGNYFGASDLVVLPYRTMIGASACLSQAIAYHKPFMVSSHLMGSMENALWQKQMEECGLAAKDISFQLRYGDFKQKIHATLSGQKLEQMKRLSTAMSQELSLKHWVEQERENRTYAVSKARVLQLKLAAEI